MYLVTKTDECILLDTAEGRDMARKYIDRHGSESVTIYYSQEDEYHCYLARQSARWPGFDFSANPAALTASEEPTRYSVLSECTRYLNKMKASLHREPYQVPMTTGEISATKGKIEQVKRFRSFVLDL